VLRRCVGADGPRHHDKQAGCFTMLRRVFGPSYPTCFVRTDRAMRLWRSIRNSGKDPALAKHWSLSCVIGSERRWVREPRPATKPGEFWKPRPLRLPRALPTGAVRACPVRACRATGRDWTLCTDFALDALHAMVAGACKPPRVCLKSHRKVVSLFDL
jgi:hypothetical protein